MPLDPIPALFLSGPTGIGKTDLAVRLAERFPLEIISADSMQVYHGLPIGTAQPSAHQRRQAEFHLCGALAPTEPFSVQRFLTLCDEAHRRILARGRFPLYVGGTGLYLRALRWGLFDQEARDPALRARLEEEIQALGAPALHARLAVIDPRAALRIAPADRVRIVRALEVHALTGRPLSELQRQWTRPAPRFPHVLAVLVAPRELLRRRIAERTDAMLAAGWADEVRALLAEGLSPRQHCFKALGYHEVIEHVQGRLAFGLMRERIILRTQQFAKRQMVWFRRERPALWLAPPGQEPAAIYPRLEKLLAKLGTPPL